MEEGQLKLHGKERLRSFIFERHNNKLSLLESKIPLKACYCSGNTIDSVCSCEAVWHVHGFQRRGWECCGMGRRQGCWSLRVKIDERVGVWWLNRVDVSVMAWCQTLCHYKYQPHQPIPQWSVTVQCVSKPLCCCHFNSVWVLLCCPTCCTLSESSSCAFFIHI